jgi:hypothetical protein
MRPQRIGEECVLRRIGPARVALLVQGVLAHHLLQEHQVGRHRTHRIAQFVQHEAPAEQVEAHVAIEREDVECGHRGVPGGGRAVCRGSGEEIVLAGQAIGIDEAGQAHADEAVARA